MTDDAPIDEAQTDARTENDTKQDATETSAEPDTAPRFTLRWIPTLLTTATVALLALGTVFVIRTVRSDDPVSSNTALVDSKTTTQVVSEVSSVLQQVLSYNFAKPQTAAQAVAKYLTGDAVGQYNLLLSQLKKLADGQDLTLVSKVVDAGVVSLHDSTAQLLVFVDQQSTRASNGQSSVAAAQVAITAARQGGTWKISGIKAL